MSKSRHLIYKGYCYEQKALAAIKYFPFKEGMAERFYFNEKKIQKINHKNIIKLYQTEDQVTLAEDDKHIEASSIVMEFAPFGDFIEIMNKTDLKTDEKLVRTYFHHLIDGLEVLHAHNIAHLDIKCENLLLGSDYQMKITDFDLCSKIGSRTIYGRGTCNCRAPELVNSKYGNFTKADIFAAGVVLFMLRFGYRPYLEMKGTTTLDLYELLQEMLMLSGSIMTTLRTSLLKSALNSSSYLRV